MRPRGVAALVAAASLALVAACSDDPAPAGEPRAEESSPAPSSPDPTSPSPEPDPPPRITLTVVGDLMLVRGVPDAAAALAPLSDRLRSADITVGNLESTLSTNGEPTQGGDSFGGTPALLGPLRRAGFDALSLANNHAGDYGSTALVETVRAFDGSRIAAFGAGADLAEASRPVVVEREGVRFAFVGFNAIGETPRAVPGGPGALSVRMPPRTGPLVPADLDHVASVVRRAAESADVVVVLPHWGTQYTHRPEPIQSTVARRLVRAGADLVVGGHPHWVQSAERDPGCAGAALAGQLRLRHGLHDPDDGGGLPGDRLAWRRARPDPAGALPDGPGLVRAAGGARSGGRRDPARRQDSGTSWMSISSISFCSALNGRTITVNSVIRPASSQRIMSMPCRVRPSSSAVNSRIAEDVVVPLVVVGQRRPEHHQRRPEVRRRELLALLRRVHRG